MDRSTKRQSLLNPLAWYDENAIRLHTGVRATRIFRFARRVIGADGIRRALRQTDHRHRQSLRSFRRSRADAETTASTSPAYSGFARSKIASRMAEYAGRQATRGGDRRRAARARVRARAAEFGLEVHVIHRSTHLMNQQLDRVRRRYLEVVNEKHGHPGSSRRRHQRSAWERAR